MDKLADTVKAIMEQGGPLARQAMEYWLFVRSIEAVANVLMAVVIVGGIYLTARYITSAVERLVR